MKILARRKNFINPSCPKHRKIINWNKKWQNFYFHTSLWCLRKVSSFWSTKIKCENKTFMSFFPLIPLGRQGLRLRFVELPTYTISVSLMIEIHKNNTDTFSVTNKQYYKTKSLSNETDISRELLPNTTDFFQENFAR